MNDKPGHILLIFLGLVVATTDVQDAVAEAPSAPWVFALGRWDLVETVYDADGELIQTNIGSAMFSSVMDGARLQETQSLLREGETTTALQLFVWESESGTVEVVRTDSDHPGFWVLAGKRTGDTMTLAAKHPDAGSKVVRRITYQRVDDDHFSRTLEFSQNKGKSWFVRSRWVYTRQ